MNLSPIGKFERLLAEALEPRTQVVQLSIPGFPSVGIRFDPSCDPRKLVQQAEDYILRAAGYSQHAHLFPWRKTHTGMTQWVIVKTHRGKVTVLQTLTGPHFRDEFIKDWTSIKNRMES